MEPAKCDTQWTAYAADKQNISLRNALIERYMPLVERIARRLKRTLPNHVQLEELVSSGVLGLIDAIEAFNVSRGAKFESYSALRIRGAILDQLRLDDRMPRMSRRRQKVIAAAQEKAWHKSGRNPTAIEVADEAGCMPAEVVQNEARYRQNQDVSLNADRDTLEGKPWHLLDQMIDRSPGAQPEYRVVSKELAARLTRGLNQHQRMIVLFYYFEQLTMKQIGETIGLSESRVSQLHAQTLRQIKSSIEEDPACEINK